MPLDLSRTSIHHGGWKDSENCGLRIQEPFLQDCSVLRHPRFQRNVVILGPASQRMEKEHRLLIASVHKLPLAVVHEQSMTIMDRIPQLECKDCVCVHLLELVPQICGREAVLVQAIFPSYLPQDLQFSSHKPVSTCFYHCDVRMAFVVQSKLTGTSFLLPVFIEFWVTENSFRFALVGETDLL